MCNLYKKRLKSDALKVASEFEVRENMPKEKTKIKSRKIAESLFQVFLILFGFILGSLGTGYWQRRETRLEKESLSKIIKIGIERELLISKKLREFLIAKKDIERLIPEGFNSLHDYSLYFSAKDRFGLLEDEILIRLDAFHRSLETCRNMKNLFQEGLLYCRRNKGKKLPDGYLQVYLNCLDLVIIKGEKVISSIDKNHPNLADFDTEVSEDPTINIIDIPGYDANE